MESEDGGGGFEHTLSEQEEKEKSTLSEREGNRFQTHTMRPITALLSR
jgi:hypothetical protein